jgi:hypothetical protein
LSRVRGDVAALKEPPPQPIATRAYRAAEEMNVLFGCGKVRTKKAFVTFESFLFSILLEIGSVVAFGHAFARQRRQRDALNSNRQQELAVPRRMITL